MVFEYDITILGGGPGGYVAAIRASQLGFKTAIIEKDNLGGICLNWGCIPTKALLKSAAMYDEIKNRSNDFGILVEGVSFDFNKIIRRSRNVSKKVVKGVEYLMRKNKIDYIKGYGKLISKNEIKIFDKENNSINKISSKNIIIATGAKPRMLSAIPVDKEKIITSTEAMSLNELPSEMIIVGAGAIGVEFAYFYNVLGTKVTVIEMLEHVVPVEDREISEALEKSFKKRGIKIYTSTKVEKAEVDNKKVKVIINKNGEKKELKANIVLSAIGVIGNTDGFGLKELGIEIQKGFIKVDENYNTNINNIYAIGDIIGAPWLAHVASAEGIHCVEKIKGIDTPAIDYNSIPGCTYTQPQIASIGFTEEQAKSKGYELKIGKFPYTASGKAAAIGEREGFVKLIFDAQYGELLGAHLFGADVTEMITEIGIAKKLEADYESIIKTIHPHPTLSEIIMEAAANAYDESIHI